MKDTKKISEVLWNLPHQFKGGFEAAMRTQVKLSPTRIIVSSVGGGAHLAEVINCVWGDAMPKSLEVSRSYTIDRANPLTLVILVSYSGNTEETLSALDAAEAYGAQIVVISTGGALIEKAIRHGHDYVQLDSPYSGFPGRFAYGTVFAALTSVLIRAGWLPASTEQEVLALPATLNNPSIEHHGRQLAESIVGTIPVFYTSEEYGALSSAAKMKVNENAKQPAWANVFPELNHNEMAGFTMTPKFFRIVMLRDINDDPRINARFEATASILRTPGIGLKTTIWDIIGETKLEKVFTTLLMLDWMSYHLAGANQVDPGTLKVVDDFKAVLK